MKKIAAKLLVPALFVVLSASASAEAGRLLLTIPTQPDQVTVPPKQRRQATLVGRLERIPAFGARLLLRTEAWGRVHLLAINSSQPATLYEQIEAKLAPFYKDGTRTVAVTGSLINICDGADLDSDTLGCRLFDNAQPVTIREFEHKDLPER